MPPHEGERDQHSEDDDKDDNIGEDFEDDSLNRGESETEPTVEESLREYYEELDEHDQPGDRDTEESTIDKDTVESEDEVSAEDKTLKHCEDTEESSRDDSEAEDDRIEQCLDEYEKTLDPSAPDSKEGDEEDDANPLEASTDESPQETEREPYARDDEATDVELNTVEHENQGINESREDLDSYDFRRCLAEYDETISITEGDPSGKTMDWKGTEHTTNEGLEDQTRELGPEKINSESQDRAVSNESNEKQVPNSLMRISSENHYERIENKEPSNAKGDNVVESRFQENQQLDPQIKGVELNFSSVVSQGPVTGAELSEHRTSEGIDLNSVIVYDARAMGVGELVREWRTELGLSQYELADKLGYDQSQISYWEINKSYVPLEDLQKLAHLAGKDLNQALSELQSRNREMGIDWKGSTYSVDMLRENIREPHATLEYHKAQQTYYLELSPMADARFRLGDRMTTLLEKDGVQAIAELTAKKGDMANIKKATVERMGIELGDKLNIKVLNVRSPEDTPWKEHISLTPTTTGGEMKIPLDKGFGQLGLRLRDGDYARMIIQTEKGEGLVSGKIEGQAVTLSRNIVDELVTRPDGEIGQMSVKTDSIIVSERLFREEAVLSIGRQGGAQIRGLLSCEGFSHLQGGETLRVSVITGGRIEGEESSRRISTRVCEPNRDIHPPYSATEQGIEMRLRTNDIVVLNPGKSETLTDHERTTSHEGTSYTPIEKSMMGTRLFDALSRHIGAETLYQVEKPTQGGIDRIIEKDGKIILVEEKAEHAYGISWRTTTTISQVIGYRNGFHELAEENSSLRGKLQGREPNGIEIWTTAIVPKDRNGEIDTGKIQMYDPSFNRNLSEGETATLKIHYVGSDGEIHVRQVPDVQYRVSTTENGEVLFSLSAESLLPSSNVDQGRNDHIEIRVRHHHHVEIACRNSALFDEETKHRLNETMYIVERRGSHN